MVLALVLNWFTSPTPLVGTQRGEGRATKYAFGEAESASAKLRSELTSRLQNEFGEASEVTSVKLRNEFGEASELSSAKLRR